MVKHRSLVHVSEDFWKRLKELQVKIRKTTGEDKSLRELTDKLAKSNALNEFESSLINQNNTNNKNIRVNIKFDRRFLQ